MTYRTGSPWNEENEIRCLIIFKKLQADGFPRGMQTDLCRGLARTSKLEVGSISAKVCNYKSVAGVNEQSNASRATREIYRKYGRLSIAELETLVGSS